MTPHRLVILYGIGGLSDVGRHAVELAIERDDIEWVRVITQHPDMLYEQSNWDCGCPGGHSIQRDDPRFTLLSVAPGAAGWETQTTRTATDILQRQLEGATAVISCLGNRQPGWVNAKIKQGWVSAAGNKAVIEGMQAHGVSRAVVISSVGIEEDAPPLEFHWAGKIMTCLFKTNTKKAFDDLTQMERAYRKSELDFLFVRPVGIGEETKPTGTWKLQQEKGKDALGLDMAKVDVARYMLEEALAPTRHKSSVVIGTELPETKSG